MIGYIKLHLLARQSFIPPIGSSHFDGTVFDTFQNTNETYVDIYDLDVETHCSVWLV